MRRMTKIRLWLGLLLLMAFSLVQGETLKDLSQPLADRSFSGKEAAISKIAQSNDPEALPLLQALMDGSLYFRTNDKRLVLAKDIDSGFAIRDAITGEELGEAGRWDVRRVGINNSIRGMLRTTLAKMQLAADDPDVRLQSTLQMLDKPDPSLAPVIDERLAAESDDDVRDMLQLVRNRLLLESDDPAVRLKAVEGLSGSLQSEVRVALQRVAKNDESAKVQAAARDALADIESLRDFNGILENLSFGVSLGSVLLLAAIGLAITFGVMGVINMAHGEMIMLGAYTTFVVQQLMPNHIGSSLFVAIPAAFLVSGLMGVIIERLVIRHLYGRPLETLLATFGISLILQQAVRSIFGPLNQSVQTPDWMSGALAVNGALSITYNRLYIVIFAFVVLFALMVLLRKSFFGLQMRAVTQNRPMASSMGIKTGWVDALTFGLGSGIAGIAGVALSQLTNVGPNLGQQYIIDSFLVVVFGGVGNLWGALVGAMTLGIANKVMEPFAGAVLAKVLVLVFIILFIQKRPRGLFALKGRAIED
ncbi:urea ABC transporter permease subunit UrtB [Marinobacteraceae bacterium S3BR75-40.1]